MLRRNDREHKPRPTYECSEGRVSRISHFRFVVPFQRHEDCSTNQQVHQYYGRQNYQGYPVHCGTVSNFTEPVGLWTVSKDFVLVNGGYISVFSAIIYKRKKKHFMTSVLVDRFSARRCSHGLVPPSLLDTSRHVMNSVWLCLRNTEPQKGYFFSDIYQKRN